MEDFMDSKQSASSNPAQLGIAEAATIRVVGEPRVFNRHTLKQHLIRPQEIVWLPHMVHLYQPGRATNPLMEPMTGKEFLGYATRGGHVLTAHFCDYLEDHPDMFFEDWRQPVGSNPGVRGTFRMVHFCGTVFLDKYGHDAIKTLFWDFEDKKLTAIFTSLNGRFFSDDFAASPRSY